MDTNDLPYLVARVAALEFLLTAMLAARTPEETIDILATAREHLKGTHYGDHLFGSSAAYKAEVGSFLNRLGTKTG